MTQYSQHKHVFDAEFGTLGEPLHMDIDNSVTPVQQPVRRLPIAMKHKLKLELDRLEKLNVIQRTNKLIDWMSSLVIVHKPNGMLRIRLDLKPLNKNAVSNSNFG